MGILTATRPWSFTAAAVPVALAAKLQGKLLSADAGKLLAMAIACQAGANLVNSFFDFTNGVDTKEAAGDESIIGGHITPTKCASLAACCFAASALFAMDFMSKVPGFCCIFAIGTGLGFFYTCPPFSLKYHFLGDLAILGAFGPVIMQSCAMALNGRTDDSLYLYGLPTTLLTECILLANNARDIDGDRKAGISTLSTMFGFKISKVAYKIMVYASYGITVCLAASRRSPGLVLPLLTLPLAKQTCDQFTEGKDEMKEAPDRTAQLHLPFGLLMLLGLVLDEFVFTKWMH